MKLLVVGDWEREGGEKFRKAVERICSQESPHFLLFLGDNISLWDELSWLKRNTCFEKILLIRGNHDKDLPNRALSEMKGSTKRIYLLDADIQKDVKTIIPKIKTCCLEKNSFKTLFVGLPPEIEEGSEEDAKSIIRKGIRRIRNQVNRYRPHLITVLSHFPPHAKGDLSRSFQERTGSTRIKHILLQIQSLAKNANTLHLFAHVHSSSGKIERLTREGIDYINLSSAVREEKRILYLITLPFEKKEKDLKYIALTDEEAYTYDDLQNIYIFPGIGFSRMKTLNNHGVYTLSQLANLSFNHPLSQHPSFKGQWEFLILNARASIRNKILIKRPAKRLKDLLQKAYSTRSVFLFDLEYMTYEPLFHLSPGKGSNPLIFLAGIAPLSEFIQLGEESYYAFFLESKREKEKILTALKEWIVNNKPLLVTYSGKSADLRILERVLDKEFIRKHVSHIDLFYDILYTQSSIKQEIFFPLPLANGSQKFREESIISIKQLCASLRIPTQYPEGLESGVEVNIEYVKYLHERDNFQKSLLKEKILQYNKEDVKCIGEILIRLSKLILHGKNEFPFEVEYFTDAHTKP